MSRCTGHRAKWGRRARAGGGRDLLALLALAAMGAMGLAALATIGACAPPAWMCVRAGDCAATSSCVAGRCVAHGAAVAISTARRVLYDPVAVGYVRRGGEASLPAMVALGRGDGALAFLRFSVSLPPEAGVVEAYLLLDRVTAVDPDPQPIALHVARIVDPWDPQSLSWAMQPRVEEVGAPVTRVLPASGAIVRLDVREIVERWRRRRGTDFGLAVVSEAVGRAGPVEGDDANDASAPPPDARPNANNPGAAAPDTRQERQGMAFALAAGSGRRGGGQGAREGGGEGGRGGGSGEGARDEGPSAPRLELYLR